MIFADPPFKTDLDREHIMQLKLIKNTFEIRPHSQIASYNGVFLCYGPKLTV